MSLALLVLFVVIGVMISGVLFFPLGWVISVNLPIWFWFALLLIPLSWLLGD
jgi:hypothetical protein